MRMFPVRNTLAGLMCLGLLGACNKSQGYEGSPASNKPVAPVYPSPTNPVTTPPPVNDPTVPTPNPAAPGAAHEQTPPAPPAATNDVFPAADLPEAQRALTAIRKINALEIEVGKLAQERATSEEVKSFARQLVEDHQAADKKVVEFASKYTLRLTATAPATMPSEREWAPVALDAKGKKDLAKLGAAKGARFDREFVTAMVVGHQKALDLIKGAKDKVNQEGFDALLTDIQSSVEKHLEHAKTIKQNSAAHAAMPPEERAVQGRRPVPIPSPDPRPALDPTRIPDPMRAPDPTRVPDPTGIPDPTRPVPDPLPGSPNPVPTPSPTP